LLLLFALLCSLVLGKYSYSDKCYCYEGRAGNHLVINDQYYVNKKGVPIGRDRIIYPGRFDPRLPPHISVYYHNVFSHCTRMDDRYNCTNTCKSIWFKIWENLDSESLSDCAKEFKGQYGDITKHSCPSYDTFLSDLNENIGRSTQELIRMNGTRPLQPLGWRELECVWEYHIIGLWSIVTIVTVSVIVLVVLILFIGLYVYAQKHRSKERKQLNHLLEQTEMV
ncbi:hypothetical protein WA588_003215, partial [Blastocystis sp. NMH]